ncbi:MAG: glycosyltransferase, partial [Planctomycetota bacterium]
MKILILNYEFPPIGGGAGNAHLCLLKEYADLNDLTIDVLTSAPNPGFTVERFAGNITIYKVGLHKKNLHYWRKIEVLEWLFKAWLPFRKLLKTNNYDLVHAFFGFPTGLLCYLSTKRLPYIISLRGSDVPGLNPRLSFDYKVLAPIFRRIWKKAAYLVACSNG